MEKGTRTILTSIAVFGFITSSGGASIAAGSNEEMPADTATLGTDSNLPTGTGARVFTKKSGTVEMVYPGAITDTGSLGIGAGGTTDADGQGGGGVKTGASSGNDTGGMDVTGNDNSGSGGDSGTGR